MVASIRDPVRRVLVLQLLRATPVPLLRLALLLAFVVWVAMSDDSPGAATIAFGFVLAGVWLVPCRPLWLERARRERWLAPLPLSTRRRAGRDPLVTALVLAPTGAAALVLLLRWSVPW